MPGPPLGWLRACRQLDANGLRSTVAAPINSAQHDVNVNRDSSSSSSSSNYPHQATRFSKHLA
jgi:SMC interacting uncharacterized protein involved in chromosome segregation